MTQAEQHKANTEAMEGDSAFRCILELRARVAWLRDRGCRCVAQTLELEANRD